MRLALVVALFALCLSAGGREPEKAPPAARPAPTQTLPDNRHDPEDRAESASGGSSAPRAAPEATDIGREADKEDEAWRKKHQRKPSSRNLR